MGNFSVAYGEYDAQDAPDGSAQAERLLALFVNGLRYGAVR
ncbi:hypothetical protein [Actinomadura sp. NBRC 104412]|nr:hypothetical protein [Actinomadura sp. NBRC 104412]